MKDDEFYELGIQAGFMDWELDDGTTRSFDPRYIRFAKLVDEKATAREREACAQTVLNIAGFKEYEFAANSIRARGEA